MVGSVQVYLMSLLAIPWILVVALIYWAHPEILQAQVMLILLAALLPLMSHLQLIVQRCDYPADKWSGYLAR